MTPGRVVQDAKPFPPPPSPSPRGYNFLALSLALTGGYQVFVCDNLAFHGDFSPVVRKHTKRVEYEEVIDAAVGKMQRTSSP
jgi:hypothetical protein